MGTVEAADANRSTRWDRVSPANLADAAPVCTGGAWGGLRRAMKPDSFWQRFFGTYRFCRNFGRESWWASFRGAVQRPGANLPGNRHSCDGHHIVLLDQVISGTSVRLCCSGGYMPTLADIYENHAEECIRAAAKADDPKRRDLLLKLASAWREDAEALKRGEELQTASAPRKAKAFGRGAEGTPDLHLPARRNKR